LNIGDVIQDEVVGHSVDLQRVAASIRSRTLRTLKRVENDLVAALARIDPTAGGPKTKQRRLQALLEQTQETIRTGYKKISASMLDDLKDLVGVETEFALMSINNSVKVELASTALAPAQIRTLAGEALIEGAPNAEWWVRMSADLQARFTDQVRRGIVAGEGLGQLTQRIRGTKARGFKDGVMNAPTASAEKLIRTSVQTVANEARFETYRMNDDVIKGVQWVATLDSRTTIICMALNGKVWDLDKKPVGHNQKWPGPTAHWNCFTEDVEISSPARIHALYRRKYSGELVTIETESGRRITATPNHPILTPLGWCALGEIQIGQNLVCQKGSGRRTAGIPNDQQRESTFGKLAEATAKLSGMIPVKVPIATPYFHGDGTDGEVCEIWPYGTLSREGNSALSKLFGNLNFNRRNLDRPDPLARLSAFLQFSPPALPPTNRIMRGLYAWLFAALPSRFQIFRPRAIHPSGFTPAQQSGQRDIESLGYLPWADLVRYIESDRVRMISRREAVSVFVHNLSTETEWYLASGIVSHNCRSTQISVLKSWDELAAAGHEVPQPDEAKVNRLFKENLRGMGFSDEDVKAILRNGRSSKDGQVAKDLTFDAWLRRKPKAVQDDMLGVAKADLWRAKKISLSEMIDQKNRPLTIDELQARIQSRRKTKG